MAFTPEKKAARLLEKWRTAKMRNSILALKDLEALGSDYDTLECEEALQEFRDVARADYSDAEEYQEARDEAWENFLERLEELAGVEEEGEVEAREEEEGVEAEKAEEKREIAVQREPVVPEVELLRPYRGGFLRPFGLGTFIREYLAGNGPYGSMRIDPVGGACQTDIREQYKTALFREHAEDAVAKELERRIKRKLPPMTVEEEDGFRLRTFARIPYKFTSIRSHSFARYFGMLTRLEWVEHTGKEETSAFQEQYSEAQPRRYFRLTGQGRAASDVDWSNPQRTLYGSSLEDTRQRNQESKQRVKERLRSYAE